MGTQASAHTLSPTAAEEIVDDLRYQFGLGQAYHLDVQRNSRGDWEVDDGLGHHQTIPPMDEADLRQWWVDTYGDVVSERLETSEG